MAFMAVLPAYKKRGAEAPLEANSEKLRKFLRRTK
jgi:hypothetical protein